MLKMFSQYWIAIPILFLYLSQTADMRMSVELENKSDDLTYIQFFWRYLEEPDFVEYRSSKLLSKNGHNIYNTRVSNNAVFFRIDPIGGQGRVTLFQVSISNIFGLPLFTWNTLEELKEWQPNTSLVPNLNASDTYSFESQLIDPNFTLSRDAKFISARRLLANLFYTLVLFCVVYLFTRYIVRPLMARQTEETTSPPPLNISPGKIFLFYLLALAISITTVIIFAEITYRIVLQNDFKVKLKNHPETGFQYRETARFIEFDQSLWGTQKEVHVQKNHFTFKLNSNGFRGEEWSADQKKKNVLVLGDSYVFGWGVDEHQTFPAILQMQLGNRYQVWNSGIPSYNTSQELATLQEILNLFQPDLIILGIVMNDASPVQIGNLIPPQVVYKYEILWIWSEIKTFVNYFFPKNQPYFEDLKYKASSSYLTEFDQSGHGWRNLKESFNEIVKICAEKKIPFNAIIFPDFTRAFDESYPYLSIHSQLLTLDKNPPMVFDMFPIFKGKDSKEYRVSWDGHPNDKAFDLVSQFLVPKIKNVVP